SLPAICGWEDIERSYAFLVSQGARSMMLWWPGYTVCTPPDVRRDMGCTLEEFLQFAGRMKALYQKPLSVLPDTVAPVTWPIRRIMSHTLRGNIKNGAGPFQGILWLSSEAAYPQLKKTVAKNAGSFGNRHYLFPVKNNTYGGNIIVAGLLMVDDFLLSGKEALRRWEDIDLVLIPRTPFDSLYKDLRQTPAYRLVDELQKPVWIINDA
ncbi:MAG: hypothetical protein NTY64_15750, partial [Deltaproteobacteria bacterium]|nr:hypothetical protein [Deltaproteobacteria bacterium]